MVIFDDYVNYHNEYTKKYGEKTIILMQVGSFFEIYAVQNENESMGADIYKICDLLNIQVSRKNKAILENNKNNHLIAGFPTFGLDKFKQLLLQNNYTIVLIEQVTPPPNPERKITEILSPSMQLTPNSIDGNYLMLTFWDIYTDIFGKRYLSLGLSGVDVSTGKTWIYEISKESSSAIDEFTRCFQMYQPREIVFLSSKDLLKEEKESIKSMTRFDNSRTTHFIWDNFSNDFSNIKYQSSILLKAFSPSVFGLLQPIDALYMEKYDNARIAFVYMIQFIYEHNPLMIERLNIPQHLSFNGHCMLEYNSAVQLQIISLNNNNSEKPLLNILNRCSTAFGIRRFREMLLQPITNSIVLQNRYYKIKSMIASEDYKEISKILKNVLDIERMTRRMLLCKFHPAEWCSFHDSLNHISVLGKLCDSDIINQNITLIQDEYINVLDMEGSAKYNMNEIKGTIFKKGIYLDIDEIADKYNTSIKNIQDLADSFEEGARIDYNEREGYFITMTAKRWETAKDGKRYMNGILMENNRFKVKPISSSSSMIRLTHTMIEKESDNVIKMSVILNELSTKIYKKFVATFSEKVLTFLQKIIDVVAELDIISTNARNAVEYNYICPTIDDTKDKSYLNAKGIRHPIIEIINNQYPYVPNDVNLGGILLFGMNSSGKSSLMKAIGLNIIMAQAGMFVSAEEFTYKPYTHIFTRICGNDNLYRGLSSFAVEMLELKNIIERADKFSLVLGDEISHGTETTSGLAIVAASVNILTNKEVSYAFATHLHDLCNLSLITENENIYICHMHIEIIDDKLVYDRKLRDGPGSSLYGLEVCRGLGMSNEFLKIAHDIRLNIEGRTNEFVATKQSKYNSAVRVGECNLCDKAATEVHHINPQMLADENGFIRHFHKNREFNLIPVCEECHNKIHKKLITLEGYIATNTGLKLIINEIVEEEETQEPIKNNKEIELYEKLRYHKNWYYKKTKRSKWAIISEDEVINICKKYNISNSIEELSKKLFDANI